MGTDSAALAGRTAVCVTGMHRSGTSFATRAVQLLGVSLGDPERLMPPGRDNPRGYFENARVKELDDEILAHLDGSWDAPPVLAPGWELDAGLDELRARAAAELAETFAATPPGEPIGWKDPRLSLLLPLWRTVSPISTTIVVVRDPAEVAASLHTRNGMPPAQAALLWLRYLLAATTNDPGHLLVRHRDFFEDLPTTLARIATHLALPAPDEATLEAVRGHLDPSLHHHDNRRSTQAASAPAATAPAESDPAGADPVTRLATQVWNGGDVDVTLVPEPMAAAVREGWLRPPVDGEALARARAKVVELTEEIRRRNREKAAARAAARGGTG
ncbi:MAG: hypothetical protein MUF83_15200 [Acidimicrobiales bacterium]|jgi:hypothetical protein|nr:hypothetical protein [Acidimicrobiales bacterium]